MPTFVRTTNGQFEPFHEYRGTSEGARKAAATRKARRGARTEALSAPLQKAVKKYGSKELQVRLADVSNRMSKKSGHPGAHTAAKKSFALLESVYHAKTNKLLGINTGSKLLREAAYRRAGFTPKGFISDNRYTAPIRKRKLGES